MSVTNYVGCHDCRVYGMMPDVIDPDIWFKQWLEDHNHLEHNAVWTNEFDEDFKAAVQGKKIVGYHSIFSEPIHEFAGPPYTKTDYL